MKRKVFHYLYFGLLFLLSCTASTFAEESITITTYYPSPYGSYNRLTTAGDTYLATASGSVGIGTSSSRAKLDIVAPIADTIALIADVNNSGDENYAAKFYNRILSPVDAVAFIGGYGTYMGFHETASVTTYPLGYSPFAANYVGASLNVDENFRFDTNAAGFFYNGNTSSRDWAIYSIGKNYFHSLSDQGYGFAISTAGDSGSYGSSKIIFQPTGANSNFPGSKIVVDTGDAAQTNRGSGYIMRVGGTDAAQFCATTSNIYIDNMLGTNTYFRFKIGSTWYNRMLLENDGDLKISGNYAALQSLDLAEAIAQREDLRAIEAGDVVVIDTERNESVVLSKVPYSRMVAGVISTKPGFLLGEELVDKKVAVKLVLSGRVPVKVTVENGPIKRGDILVTSSKPGYAMRGEPDKIGYGMAIGKAMAELQEGEGTITVLITRN